MPPLSAENPQFSKTKIVFMAIIIAGAYCVWGALLSLLPPFYPLEAEKKGATPAQYGFVFGIANLTAFLSAPFFGRYGTKIGPKLLYNVGAFLQAFVGIAFGFLTYIKDPDVFIGISYFLRFLSGISDVAAWSAVLSILIKLFPNSVGKIMSWTELFFGLGYMMGPAIGSVLYNAGGFLVPFVVTGGIGLITATGLLFIIPNVKSDGKVEKDQGKLLTYRQLTKYPSIYLPFVDNTVSLFANSMMISMMTPHLEEAGATTSQVGLAFLVFGAAFGIWTFVIGWVCDRIPYPSMVSCFGNTVMFLAYFFLGPLPFLPIEPTVALLITTMGFMAIGMSSVIVSSLTRAQNSAMRKGFVKDLETYLMISGLWSSSFYLGNFLGSTIAGIIVEQIGFRNTTIIYWAVVLLATFLDFGELFYNVKNKLSQRSTDYQELK